MRFDSYIAAVKAAEAAETVREVRTEAAEAARIARESDPEYIATMKAVSKGVQSRSLAGEVPSNRPLNADSRNRRGARRQAAFIGHLRFLVPHPPERPSMATALNRSKENPWTLKTAPGTSAYAMYADEKDGKKILVCRVGSTHLHYDARCIDDLYAMLKNTGDWVELGGTDEQKPAKEGTVEAWGRSPNNPVGGWYGLKKGLRGRFGVYIPPLMEELGLCELEHHAKNNRMRAE